MTDKSALRAVMYQALAEPVGLLLSTNDPERARQQFYAARREAQDPALARLQFRLVAFSGGNIAITKGEAKP